MRNKYSKLFLYFFIVGTLFVFIFQSSRETRAQNVKRIVILKVDGLPGDYVNRFVEQRDPKTGKSLLPWFEEVFYKNGTRLANFYTRGMSLSAPSWSILDTGQHLQIKGNVEYDRYTLRSYDYLNFLPLQINYGLKKQVDMPAVEVLDQLKIPLLSDAFDYKNRYTSFQLIQRGNHWKILANGFLKFLPRKPEEFIDEWTTGFDFRDVTVSQNERDIIYKLNNRPEINYFDYFSGIFDHVSHGNNDTFSRLQVLKELDQTVGRIWTAIQSSPQADETALVVVSDHGFNSDEKIYSQGFNLIKILTSAAGGGHHVITQRRLLRDYSIMGIYPLMPLITTASNDSYYLKNQSGEYPTALVDFDGNERLSLHLRNADLNILQILFQQLQNGKLSPAIKQAAKHSFFSIIDRNRETWQKEVFEINEELEALQRQIASQQKIIAAQPKKFAPEEIAKGIDEAAIRLVAQTNIAIEDVEKYREYIRVLANLIALEPENFDAGKLKIENYIAKGAMGDSNSIYQMQNYTVGLSEPGLTLDDENELDEEKSFKRVNYFELLENQTVRNNVQTEISNHPVDFAAARIPLDSIASALSPDEKPDEAPVWIYGGEDKQALILTRTDAVGNQIFRYLPIANLRLTQDGKFSFQKPDWSAGFPLKIFEDENLSVPLSERAAWLNGWHTETDWIRATHKTLYSIGVVSLNEQLDAHPFNTFDNPENLSNDEKLIFRFRQRQRTLTASDVLVLANNHWNFDVRGSNPGGNHGSFFRVSTNSTLMIAGGGKTGIPRGLVIEKPYESLSFAPTILRLLNKVDNDNKPVTALYQRGFRKFPGRIVREIFSN